DHHDPPFRETRQRNVSPAPSPPAFPQAQE
uniref:Uncharacterized protein n=1 Tax=Aegilops tauschii subsp. strangulata TaxID=200361 RepID=A0A453BY72_AEGTS